MAEHLLSSITMLTEFFAAEQNELPRSKLRGIKTQNPYTSEQL